MAFLQAVIPGKRRIAQWWHGWKNHRASLAELGCCGVDEVARIAHDLSLTSWELRELAGKGKDSARLLFRRMADLGVDQAAFAGAEPTVMRDMQKVCTMCHSKARCERDLDRGANPSAWHAYCPNARDFRHCAGPVIEANPEFFFGTGDTSAGFYAERPNP